MPTLKPSLTKVERTADELLMLVRQRLNGRFAAVRISIEPDGHSWKAIAHIASPVTRDLIERSVRKVRELNELAD